MKTSSSEIAIIGMACRFPGAENYEQFWENLEEGINSISEVPSERWKVEDYYSTINTPHKTISKWGGFIENFDKFDADFFGISPREAIRIDPQQRIMLELSWTCLEDAGYAPDKLSGSQVGVFIGACNYDYNQLQYDLRNIEGHTATGSYICMIANRISYFFNFHGPSIVVDTACSSSLVAIHQAVSCINQQECNMALVGGISVLCTPTSYISFSKLGMLSPTGQCRTFDDKADGYVRGEGAGIILLKPIEKAILDKDNIYGVIKGIAVNHGGKSRTLISPNIYAQAQLLKSAYTHSNILPNTVSYIETHGIGTPLGDPIEINALKRSFKQLYKQYHLPLEEQKTCGLGTVKTHIGHLESASGIASVIKVLLSIKHKKIPKVINLEKLSSHINLDNSPFYIVNQTQEWLTRKSQSGEMIPRRAGVNAFGFGGVNAHIILEEPPVRQQKIKIKDKGKAEIFTLSAQTNQSLEELTNKYNQYLHTDPENSLSSICFTANVGRVIFSKRLAIVAHSKCELKDKLETYLKNYPFHNDLLQTSHKCHKIAFVFAGQGTEYINMGKQLYEVQSVFRKTIDQCYQILKKILEHFLLEAWYPCSNTEDLKISDSIRLKDKQNYTSLAIFVLEYSLAKLWESWGISPDILMGQDVGEYVAACIAGIFSLEDALKLLVIRTKFIEGKSWHNPCEEESVITRELSEFRSVTQKISYNLPQIKLVSTITGQIVKDEMSRGEYWLNHLNRPLRFEDAFNTLREQGYGLFLEIGPQPILLNEELQHSSRNKPKYLTSLSRDSEDHQQMLCTLGELYVEGAIINWSGFYQGVVYPKSVLPTYPFQRQRYWINSSLQQYTNNVPNNSNLIIQLLNTGNITQLSEQVISYKSLTEQQKEIVPQVMQGLVDLYQHYDYVDSDCELDVTQETFFDIFEKYKKQNSQKDKEKLLVNYFKQIISKALQVKEHEVDINKPLNQMGLDSMISLEIRNQIQSQLKIELVITKFMEEITIQGFSSELYTQLSQKEQSLIQDDCPEDKNGQKINEPDQSNWIELEL